MTDNNWVNKFSTLHWSDFEPSPHPAQGKNPKLLVNVTVFWLRAQIQEIPRGWFTGLQKA